LQTLKQYRLLDSFGSFSSRNSQWKTWQRLMAAFSAKIYQGHMGILKADDYKLPWRHLTVFNLSVFNLAKKPLFY